MYIFVCGPGHGEIDDLLDEATEPVQSSGPPPEMTIRYQNQKGEWRCKGGKDLKQSQHYPRKSLDFSCLIIGQRLVSFQILQRSPTNQLASLAFVPLSICPSQVWACHVQDSNQERPSREESSAKVPAQGFGHRKHPRQRCGQQ